MSCPDTFTQTPEERLSHLNHRINSLGCEVEHLSRLVATLFKIVKELQHDREERCDAEDSEPRYIGDIGHHRAVRGVQPHPAR